MPRSASTSEPPTRERILRAAKHLFQQRGYDGVGTAEILALAEAPKGSMYHHFPLGKEQIAIAAVELIRDEIAQMSRKLLDSHTPVAEMVRLFALAIADWLRASRWQQGTMLASTTIGAVPDLPQLHAALAATLQEWRTNLLAAFAAEGWRKSEARAMSDTVISALEGACILARIDQSEKVLLNVANTLSAMLSAPRLHVSHARAPRKRESVTPSKGKEARR